MARGVDTRLWNLAFVGAAVGCGPAVPVDANDEGDGREPCLLDYGCDEGMICVDEYCVPGERGTEEGGSGESGCSHYEYCYDYECDGDDDCGPGEVCTRGYYEWPECELLPTIPECGGSSSLIQLPLEVDGSDSVERLRFIHADDDGLADLAVVRSSRVEIVFAQGERAVIERAGVLDVAAGDFDRDGQRDLVLADEANGGTLGVWIAGADGAYALSFNEGGITLPRLVAGVTWTDEDEVEDDLAVLDAAGVLRVLPGPSFGGGFIHIDEGGVSDFAVGDFDEDGRDDLVYTMPKGVWQSFGEEVIEDDRDRNGVLAGRFDGTELGIVTHTLMPNDWMLFEGDAGVRALLRPENLAESGDVDGDGADDIVLFYDTGVTLVRGGVEDPLWCYSVLLDYPTRTLALGDIDGDGAAEIAMSDGVTVMLFRSG